LDVGSTGPAVVLLQKGLSAPVTGTFDLATQRAVVAYQAEPSRGLLPATGGVGPMTWRSLEDRIRILEERDFKGVERFEDFSQSHKEQVVAGVNYHLRDAFANYSLKPPRCVATVIAQAGSDTTRARQDTDRTSTSVLLRNMQRYFYGRLSLFANRNLIVGQMKDLKWDAASGGAFDLSDPSVVGQVITDIATLGYAVSKGLGLATTATAHPASPSGGEDYVAKGEKDAWEDFHSKVYSKDQVPALMTAQGISETQPERFPPTFPF
jgi:hypothetical protein